MMKPHIPLAGWLAGIVLLASCQSELREQDMPASPAETEFHINLNPQTRAPQDLDTEAYNAKVYMFAEEASGTDRYTYQGEADIKGSTFKAEGLAADMHHRFVFVALPKTQAPKLPSHTDDKPLYTEAYLTYIDGNQTDHEVFRAILDFIPEQGNTTSHNVVLTRQNGALQVRLNNANGTLKSVKLEVVGMPEMYLHDGTGGKVITKGTPVNLSKEEHPQTTADYRITLNLLPVEDVTGKGKLTLTYQDGTQKEYPLQSTHGSIPVFPNQITWLTLDGTGGEGNFDVNFGPDIDLDDDQWDGIHQ